MRVERMQVRLALFLKNRTTKTSLLKKSIDILKNL